MTENARYLLECLMGTRYPYTSAELVTEAKVRSEPLVLRCVSTTTDFQEKKTAQLLDLVLEILALKTPPSIINYL